MRREYIVAGVGGRKLTVRIGSGVTFPDFVPGTLAKVAEGVMDLIVPTRSGIVIVEPCADKNGVVQVVMVMCNVDGKSWEIGVAVSNLLEVEF